MSEIKAKCINILCNLGIIVDEVDEEDISLIEYGIDSLSFISFIVEVERAFDIIIPDELLVIDSISSLNGFCAFIEDKVEEKKNFKAVDNSYSI